VWTPKRILLLVVGFASFCLAYGIYAYFLGGVDGLPPLPEELEPSTGPGVEFQPRQPPELDRKLKMAFGGECPEQKRAIKLERRDKGLLLAADNFSIEPDGRVKFSPFSLVLFGKEADNHFPEINTIQSDIAYVRFDQRVNNIQELASRKIVGAELVGDVQGRDDLTSLGVKIKNNRRTPAEGDDLTLLTRGPVYYEESRQLIWTPAFVRIVDEQNKDGQNPTIIEAVGMDVYLATDSDGKPAATATAPKRGDKQGAAHKENLAGHISGVQSVALRSDVDMRLYVDGHSGFLGMPQRPTVAGAATPKDAPAGKDLVHIKTQGPFNYDAVNDRGRFDVSEHPGGRSNSVEVIRRTGPQGACDQLDCEHLTLQFQRKSSNNPSTTGPSSPLSDNRTAQLEIESAHAWGSLVTLASDMENLAANGTDLVYDARTRETVLKGSPELLVLKDGNQIKATLLTLLAPGDKEAQQARIKGPGTIDWLDSVTKERTQQARFQDQLISAKEGANDVLTLTGDACFEELEPGQKLQPGQTPKLKQRLQADRLKVWLTPAQPSAPGSGGNSNDPQRRRPHHLEAVGQVSAQSSEMTVHDTERLVIWFKDAPEGRVDTTVAKPPAAANAPSSPGNNAGPKTPTPTNPAPPPDKPRRPIDLRARSVEAHVVQVANHNDLEKLWCEGAVHVRQEPESKDDKGVDITGQTLQLVKFPEGHILTVTGAPAEVQLDKLTILGPEVNIDQKDNKAWVNGLGAMRMPSNAKLGTMQDGRATSTTAKPSATDKPTELTVHWNRDMFFDGRRAVYHGGVQAEQDNSHLTCLEMQVFLDRFVSLKEGDKSGPPAKVENLVCDKSVRVEDTDRQNGRLVRYQRIESQELSFNNEEGVMLAPGPGVLRILQWGTKGEAGPNPTPAKPSGSAPPEEELKLTRVNYFTRMFANNNTRTAVFYDNVEVVHLPTGDPDLVVDIDKLPEGALYMSCDQLKVYSRQEANNKGNQQMEARGHAKVQSKEFWGRADVIKYDESKELVVFEASEGNLATLVRQKGKGTQQEEVKGKKIYYWRKTNDFKIEGGTGARVIQ
jgi:lipopolysaccharide export system protein LptA